MPSFSRPLEETLHRAVGYANARRHEYATLEHLLDEIVEPLTEEGPRLVDARRVDDPTPRQAVTG